MDPLFVAKDSSSATDFVIDQIKELLLAGKLRPGDRLPSELELASGLGVSRGSIRAAMKAFEVCGIVDIRRGDGTYICSRVNSKSFNPMVFSLAVLDPDIDQLTKFREKIELDIIELIIKDPGLTQAILPRLKANLDELNALRAQGASANETAANDRAFHEILAGGCGNIVFETIYTYILDFFYPLIVDSHEGQIRGADAEELHQNIYNAISQSSYSMAKDAIVASMQYWYQSLQR